MEIKTEATTTVVIEIITTTEIKIIKIIEIISDKEEDNNKILSKEEDRIQCSKVSSIE